MFAKKNKNVNIEELNYLPMDALFNCRITIPDSWVRYTQENIARSQKERAASERLRGEIDSTLRACANEMWNQFNSVNNAFNTRIRETTDARNKLQAHLQRVRHFVCFLPAK